VKLIDCKVRESYSDVTKFNKIEKTNSIDEVWLSRKAAFMCSFDALNL